MPCEEDGQDQHLGDWLVVICSFIVTWSIPREVRMSHANYLLLLRILDSYVGQTLMSYYVLLTLKFMIFLNKVFAKRLHSTYECIFSISGKKKDRFLFYFRYKHSEVDKTHLSLLQPSLWGAPDYSDIRTTTVNLQHLWLHEPTSWRPQH